MKYRTTFAKRPVRPYSTSQTATPTPKGTAIALAMATISIVPRMADSDAARIAEEAAGRVGGEEVDAEGAEALLEQVVEDRAPAARAPPR